MRRRRRQRALVHVSLYSGDSFSWCATPPVAASVCVGVTFVFIIIIDRSESVSCVGGPYHNTSGIVV